MTLPRNLALNREQESKKAVVRRAGLESSERLFSQSWMTLKEREEHAYMPKGSQKEGEGDIAGIGQDC